MAIKRKPRKKREWENEKRRENDNDGRRRNSEKNGEEKGNCE